jgi:hypothetical protein
MLTRDAVIQILTAFQSEVRFQTIRVFNCPKTVGALQRAGILTVKRTHRKLGIAWKHCGPEMNGGLPSIRGYVAYVERGPNFEEGINGISALLALLPCNEPSTRHYCDRAI